MNIIGKIAFLYMRKYEIRHTTYKNQFHLDYML